MALPFQSIRRTCPIRLVCGHASCARNCVFFQGKYRTWVDWTQARSFVVVHHLHGGLNIDDFHFDDPSSEEESASESEPTEVKMIPRAATVEADAVPMSDRGAAPSSWPPTELDSDDPDADALFGDQADPAR